MSIVQMGHNHTVSQKDLSHVKPWSLYSAIKILFCSNTLARGIQLGFTTGMFFASVFSLRSITAKIYDLWCGQGALLWSTSSFITFVLFRQKVITNKISQTVFHALMTLKKKTIATNLCWMSQTGIFPELLLAITQELINFDSNVN